MSYLLFKFGSFHFTNNYMYVNKHSPDRKEWNDPLYTISLMKLFVSGFKQISNQA